jgi:hypothetical protein
MEGEDKNITDSSNKSSCPQLEPYQWKPGQSGNPGGRKKNTLKEYVSKKFMDMSDEEKEEFIKKVAPDMV